jgi:hypothetical protein
MPREGTHVDLPVGLPEADRALVVELRADAREPLDLRELRRHQIEAEDLVVHPPDLRASHSEKWGGRQG